jgi:hypothetical protein
MPAPAHEVLLQLLHDHPALLSALLQKLTGVAPTGPLAPADANLRFADPEEVRPDLVFHAQRPRWILLELQNRVDPDKAARWILAVAVQLAATGSMGDLIVLTASPRVASWAKGIAHARGDLGTAVGLEPVVLLIAGKVIDLLLDDAHPELAFFAAWAVRARRGPEAKSVVSRAAVLTNRLPVPLRDAAVRAIVAVLGEPMLAYLRELSMNPDHLPETRAGRRFRMFFEEKGKTEGKAEGKAEGKREAVLAVLEARGLAMSEAQRAVVAACSDATVLAQWIVRAATASSAAEVLAQSAPRRAAAKRRRPAPKAPDRAR